MKAIQKIWKKHKIVVKKVIFKKKNLINQKSRL